MSSLFAEEEKVAAAPKKKRVAKISNVGAIDVLEIPIEPGRVVVLRGRNGAGKSTAQEAIRVAATTGSKSKGALTPRDGNEAEGGNVEMNGVSLRIGARMTERGVPEESYVLLDDGNALQDFCEPSVKTPKLADNKRIKAMLAMAGVKIDAAKLKAFLGDATYNGFIATYRGILEKPMVDVVEELRDWLQKQGLGEKKAAQEAKGAKDALSDVAEVDVCAAVPVGDLLAVLTDAKLKLQQWAQSRKQADEALEALGAVDESREAGVIREELDLVKASLVELRAQIRELEIREGSLDTELTSRLASDKRMEAARAKIDTAPSAEQISELTKEVLSLQSQYETAVVAESNFKTLSEKKAKYETARQAYESSTILSEQMYKKAENCIDLLRDSISKFEGWSINGDLRLCCKHPTRGEILFAEFSPGERLKEAIKLMLPAFKVEAGWVPILEVPQSLFESLDIDGREELVRLCAQYGICAVCAQCRQSHDEPVGLNVMVL
mgnify:FL=1|jgi:energy-coupling factor transporter ATP-binding protein EcfA2